MLLPLRRAGYQTLVKQSKAEDDSAWSSFRHPAVTMLETVVEMKAS